jgi:receptor protein-tyrosine kinase
MVETGERVMLIDADLRSSSLPGELKVDGGTGLTDVLDGTVPLDKAAQPVGDQSDFLVVPSGHQGDGVGDLLARVPGSRLTSALHPVGTSVVVFTSPVLAYTDAAVLGPLCDQVILVVTTGRTRRRDLTQAIERLSRLGSPVLGMVLVGGP